ncbi:acyl-CoA dehydrogenase family protein [Tardiphaga sp. OK245]|uniref:acyl-CoA dehydrogenase family protein n=1 Tax=Tardiphaga sp. OK245 TaxID=1855306 RepID=UPI0008A72D65|nr:acyl-CoA dehydrogenase family protein [Tardiphaga sp. OK245]SEI08962.1 Acyl-CoA dehydrogenase [Tardiphaga sp. OK245]
MNYQHPSSNFAMTTEQLASREATAERSKKLAPDCAGSNFFEMDHNLQALLLQYIDATLLDHIRPHLDSLGELCGNELHDLADASERHPPVLRQRDRYGRDDETVEYHPAYQRMEEIAYARYGIHAMSYRPGVLGWPTKLPPIVKYVFQYIFSQTEFGLMCPVNIAGSSSELIRRYGSDEVRTRFVDRMLSQDMNQLYRAAQFMTEKAGGSDVGAAELVAARDGENWRLWGEKWFCSNVSGDVVVVLARPEGAQAGGKGLGLFAMPKHLADGTRNAYRVVRIKDKLGSKSMASGEVRLEGAVAYQLGDLNRGLKQMLEMVNSSRVSHLARAAGMMRRCLNEALVATRNRNAFGKSVIDHPLMRRQLLKLMVPTEQALSALLFTASVSANEDQPDAQKILRIMTPICKYRACRDNVTVATGSMEARGGNGYIEDWPNAKLVRDAHLGVLWDGTSNINALDAIHRSIKKEQAHLVLQQDLETRLKRAEGLPGQFRTRLENSVRQAFAFAAEIAAEPDNERFCRLAAGQLYHAVTMVLLAEEGLRAAATGGDARRLLLARFVLEHRLQNNAPLNIASLKWEEAAIDLLLDDGPISLDRATTLLVA